MPIAEFVMALQAGANQSPASPAVADYFVLAVLAAVLGLVVVMFVRTSGRRTKRRG